MTNLNLDTREATFTQAEFASIPRNADGDITGDLQMLQCWMTEEQRNQLSEDDFSRAMENDEEMQYMLASVRAEFEKYG